MDYMGSLGGSSITDMLPDKLLIQPTGDTYTRSGKHVRVGLYVFTCPACGKRFEATQKHGYKVTDRDGQHMYCSYKCFRPVEKAMEDKFKADCLGFVAVNSRDKPPLVRAQIRVDKCKRMMEEYKAVINDPVRWNALTEKQKHSKKSNFREWRRKLDEALEALETLEQFEKEF